MAIGVWFKMGLIRFYAGTYRALILYSLVSKLHFEEQDS